MADLMVTVMPFAGHVAPVLRATEALLDAGHEVRVYVGSAYDAAFRGLGVEVVPWRAAPDFDEHDLPATFPQSARTGPRGLLANVEHVFIRSAPGQVADLRAEFHRRPWDVLVGDSLSLGGALAAETMRTPWATLSVVPLSMPSRDLPPPNLPVAPARGPLGVARDIGLRLIVNAATTGLRRAYRDVRTEIGLDPLGRVLTTAFFSPHLVLALGVAGLEAPRSDLPDHVHFIGAFAPPAVAEAPLGDWARIRASALPIVYVTQGTFNVDPQQLIRPALIALADRPVQTVVTTGADGPGRLPFEAPDDVFIAGRLPYDELLPRTDVMITNGGWGGVLAALARGVPLIVAGSELDKPIIAAMVGRSGAGIDLGTGTPRAARIRRALARLDADPSFRLRAAALAAEFAAHDTGGELAALVERLVETRAAVNRAGPAWPTDAARRRRAPTGAH